jgi:hypothetical protein
MMKIIRGSHLLSSIVVRVRSDILSYRSEPIQKCARRAIEKSGRRRSRFGLAHFQKIQIFTHLFTFPFWVMERINPRFFPLPSEISASLTAGDRYLLNPLFRAWDRRLRR